MRNSLVTLFLMLLGCDTGGPSPVISHPTRENIPAGPRVVLLDEAELLAADTMRWDWGARVEIGKLQGLAPTVFGEVADVEPLNDTVFLVLDRRMTELRAFSTGGRHLGSIGRGGRGPGEFLDPAALEVTPDGLVHVLDRTGKVATFRSVTTDGHFALEHVRDLSLDMAVEGFCASPGGFVVQGWSPTRRAIFHHYDTEDGIGESFGDPYESSNWLVEQQLSDAVFDCEDEITFAAFESLPVLRGLDGSGEPVWEAVLSSFTTMVMEETTTPDGRPSLQRKIVEPYDYVLSVVTAPSGELIVQTGRNEWQNGDLVQSWLTTYGIDQGSGEGRAATRSLPRLHSVTDSHLYGSTNDPFPKVYVIPLRDSLPILRPSEDES